MRSVRVGDGDGARTVAPYGERSASTTWARWSRTACSAASASPLATASTIARCSACDCSARPGTRIVRYWKRTSWELSDRDQPRDGAVPRDLEQARVEPRVQLGGAEQVVRRRAATASPPGSPAARRPAALVTFCAAYRAASPSSTMRDSRISAASCSSTSRTLAPRFGSCSTRPSCTRRTSAVRTADRDACEQRDQVRLDEALVGLEPAADDRGPQPLVRVLRARVPRPGLGDRRRPPGVPVVRAVIEARRSRAPQAPGSL